MRLSKAGYYGGSPSAVLQAPVDEVFRVLHYERFLSDYESVYHAMNRPKH